MLVTANLVQTGQVHPAMLHEVMYRSSVLESYFNILKNLQENNLKAQIHGNEARQEGMLPQCSLNNLGKWFLAAAEAGIRLCTVY